MLQLENYPLRTLIFHSGDAKANEWTFSDYAQIAKGYLLRDVTQNQIL